MDQPTEREARLLLDGCMQMASTHGCGQGLSPSRSDRLHAGGWGAWRSESGSRLKAVTGGQGEEHMLYLVGQPVEEMGHPRAVTDLEPGPDADDGCSSKRGKRTRGPEDSACSVSGSVDAAVLRARRAGGLTGRVP